MFGKQLQRLRKNKNLTSLHIAKSLGIKQPTISYFETREPIAIDLYLSFLSKREINLTEIFRNEAGNTAKLLKKERQKQQIHWKEICDSIGLSSQSSLSYLENREDTSFFKYLSYLVKEDVDINEAFNN